MASEKVNNIPVIDSDIFDGNPEAQFAIGAVSINNQVINGYQREFAGAAQLRANVYLDKGFINVGDLDENGTELNEDDERSVHLVVVERLSADSLARVIGNMRLVVKNDEAPLPIETLYPEAFQTALPQHSVEVSRLIATHENRAVQNMVKWSLFIAGLKHVDENNLGPVYGLIEKTLARSLTSQHVPVTPLADVKYIDEIHVAKQPVQIDVQQLKRVVSIEGDQGITTEGTAFSYLDFGSRGEPIDTESREEAS